MTRLVNMKYAGPEVAFGLCGKRFGFMVSQRLFLRIIKIQILYGTLSSSMKGYFHPYIILDRYGQRPNAYTPGAD